jgi:hypothetical protein
MMDRTDPPEQQQAPQEPQPDTIGEAIGELLRGISDRMDVEDEATLATAGGSKLLDDARATMKAMDPEAFHFALTYPIGRVVRALLKREFPNSEELCFIFAEQDYLRWHFRNLFQEYEGSSCCADKAGSVMRRLVRYFADGRPIEFDRASKYTYAFPTRILTTQEEILDAFHALHRLRRGDLRPAADLMARLEKSANGEGRR